MNSTIESNRNRKYFTGFLCKRGLPYIHRKSGNSHYYEVAVRNKVILIRISDHENIAEWNPWRPDISVTDAKTLRYAKQLLKKREKT